MATPKVTRTLFDQNLDRSVPQGPQNRSIVLLGTGTDGPMYEPTSIASPAEAADIFGAFGNGTLTRGVKECFDAQAGSVASPNVFGMRIGGSKADRAELLLYGCSDEQYTDSASCTGAQEQWNLIIKVESLYEGSIYNGVYLQKQIDLDGTYIYVWNPKTQLFSKFKIEGAAGDLDILNLPDLVSSMNADPNVNSILFSDEINYDDNLELLLDNTTNGEFGYIGSNKVDVNLELAEGANWSTHAPLKEVGSLYSISSSAEQTAIAGAGKYSVTEFNIGDGYISSDFGTIIDGADIGSAAKKVYFALELQTMLDSGNSASITLASGITESVDIEIGVDLGDGSSGTAASGTITGATIVVSNTTTSVSFTYENQVLDLSGNNDAVTATWTSGIVHDTLIALDANWNIGDAITVKTSFSTSEKPTDVTQVTNTQTPTKLTEFRVSATQSNTIEFGGITPYNMKFRLARLKYYEEGSTFFVNDTASGAIQIVDAYLVANATTLRIGSAFSYIHDMVEWGNAPLYLEGGANGALMTNAELKADLDLAYEHFVSDEFDVMCVVDLTLDATTESEGSVTSAGFGDQMSTFLDNFNGEMIGVIGFEPLEGNGVGGRVLRSDVSDRITKLTAPDSSPSGQLKAASILSDFHQPFMYAVDIEGIFSANGVRYTAIATAAVAGLIGKIPTEEAIFRFTVPGMLGMRYRYTETDVVSGERQVDLLSNARIATGLLQDGGVKITESRSLASAGSDFENMMTVLILQETLEICRSVSKDFIGKVSSAPLIQAFQSQIDKSIGDALVPRVLRGFKAPITMTPGERVLGKITIPLTLSPQFEIRDVHYNVQLSSEDIV